MPSTPNSLREGVRRAYSAAASAPAGEHPFPVGRSFAESVGYPRELLDELPAECVEAFTGVSNLSVAADIPPGARVLDLGCGAGLDALIAARRAGAGGAVLGIDFSRAMLDRARGALERSGRANVAFVRADAERLPVADAAVDVALVNGIVNLNPARAEILAELARVVRPGGTVHVAELVLAAELPPGVLSDESSWFA